MSRRRSLTMDRWFTEWLDLYKSRRVKTGTLRNYRAVYRAYLRGSFGNRLISDITPVELQLQLNSLVDDGYSGSTVRLVVNQTYPLLAQATAALVTSGTATLETCMFDVPQVVCYETPVPTLIAFLRRHLLKVKYVSLVNLIADREVVRELVADTFSVENIRRELEQILPGGSGRQQMLSDYEQVYRRLGNSHAADEAARIMVELLHSATGDS